MGLPAGTILLRKSAVFSTKDEKKKQQELIQTQITVLQAQLAALQHQQAEEEQKKQEQAPGKVEGVNSPTDDHQIDIYI